MLKALGFFVVFLLIIKLVSKFGSQAIKFVSKHVGTRPPKPPRS